MWPPFLLSMGTFTCPYVINDCELDCKRFGAGNIATRGDAAINFAVGGADPNAGTDGDVFDWHNVARKLPRNGHLVSPTCRAADVGIGRHGLKLGRSKRFSVSSRASCFAPRQTRLASPLLEARTPYGSFVCR